MMFESRETRFAKSIAVPRKAEQIPLFKLQASSTNTTSSCQNVNSRPGSSFTCRKSNMNHEMEATSDKYLGCVIGTGNRCESQCPYAAGTIRMAI